MTGGELEGLEQIFLGPGLEPKCDPGGAQGKIVWMVQMESGQTLPARRKVLSV